MSDQEPSKTQAKRIAAQSAAPTPETDAIGNKPMTISDITPPYPLLAEWDGLCRKLERERNDARAVETMRNEELATIKELHGNALIAKDKAESELSAVREQLAAANKRADHYQSECAKLSDKYAGTPCAEIRYQQELAEANKRAEDAEISRKEIFDCYRVLADKWNDIARQVLEIMGGGNG